MAIGIERDGEAYGLLVDSVGEVMRISDETRTPNPINLDPRLAALSAGVFRLERGLLIVLDIDRVLDFDLVTRAA
jgi:purine-binding chemotaxis protein CheW